MCIPDLHFYYEILLHPFYRLQNTYTLIVTVLTFLIFIIYQIDYGGYKEKSLCPPLYEQDPLHIFHILNFLLDSCKVGFGECVFNFYE